MKVSALILLAVGYASALRSGPYLPSGWRPAGPAFVLPSEAQRIQEEPKEIIVVEESEASGSDSLREYGPPKEVAISEEINQQALPEIITEQAFAVIETSKQNEEQVTVVKEEVREVENLREANLNVEDDVVVIEAKFTQNVEEVKVNEDIVADVTTEIATEKVTETSTEVLVEQISEREDVAVTQSEAVVEKTTENVELVRTDVKLVETENIVEVNEEANTIVSSVQEIEKKEEEDVQIVREGVRNIEEALVNLENEIKSQQVQEVSEVIEAKKDVVDSGSLEQAPEGFLEYGPPGFNEYGPPKDDIINADAAQAQLSEQQLVESNETRRRRRFSPKFRHASKGN